MAVTLKDILSSTPAYDGSSNFDLWASKLSKKLKLAKIDDVHAIIIFDKVLIGQVKSLWDVMEDKIHDSIDLSMVALRDNFGSLEAKQAALDNIMNNTQTEQLAVPFALNQIMLCQNYMPQMTQIEIISYIHQGLNLKYQKLIIANSISSINSLLEVLARLDRVLANSPKPLPRSEINYFQNR